MALAIITENRNGKLFAQPRLLTSEVMKILREFDAHNDGTLDQDDLLCVIGDVQHELDGDCNSEDFDLCAAIFVNAKNYLVNDEEELLQELEGMDIAIHLKRGTWVPSRQVLDSILCFVSNDQV